MEGLWSGIDERYLEDECEGRTQKSRQQFEFKGLNK